MPSLWDLNCAAKLAAFNNERFLLLNAASSCRGENVPSKLWAIESAAKHVE